MMFVVKLAAEHSINVDDVKLYLNLSDDSLKLVQNYFNLDKPLYFAYTHLVCRTALDGG